jgi:hypothetical protein
MTDGLANGLGARVNTNVPNVVVLNVSGKPDSLYALPQDQLDELRAHVLKPFKASFRAPNRVALYRFTQGGWVIENFNDEPVDVTLNGQPELTGRIGCGDWIRCTSRMFLLAIGTSSRPALCVYSRFFKVKTRGRHYALRRFS